MDVKSEIDLKDKKCKPLNLNLKYLQNGTCLFICDLGAKGDQGPPGNPGAAGNAGKLILFYDLFSLYFYLIFPITKQMLN